MSTRACASCGAANSAGALFCGSCGAPLRRECPSCGAAVSPDLAFCTSCGAALAARGERPATEERKIVSVLFADLVGFTARAEKLDPEDVRGVLAPYWERAKTELERFGGTVEKFIGDAVMALFGAPIAHEDDPERAVRAGLAVREAIAELNSENPELALQIRIGVTTGEALVRRDARPSAGEGMAAGDVVNTAARLQAHAPVDGILVDEATYRATEHTIDYHQGESVAAKGKAAPVSAWEALAPKARLGVDIAFRGGAPLVGRENELDALRDALARAQRARTAQLVTLVGVPGIGKSRLVYELWETVNSDPELLVYWRQGRSLPYGEGVSFWALGEMAKAQAGILESDDAGTAEEKLRSTVAHTVPEPGEAAWVEGHLRPLVGLGAETASGDRRNEAFAAWRRFFEALAEQRPLVLVFEDVHWADEGLLEFVDHLVEWATDVPLLVVCTARPELLERRPDWGGGKRHAATISLSALSDEDTAELVETLVGKLNPELVAHSGGNPLYAEEYARMLAQSGNGGTLALPDTVQGIIAARLDTLPVAEKALVQDAAVLGKVFWSGEVRYVAGLDSQGILDERLHALELKEFIRRERRSSVAGETAYVFRHALLRDVAYSQIPRSRRAEKHVRAANWIESLAGDRREDLADVVAHHYLSALELARAAGEDTTELAERARFALREAGDRATGLSALEAAERFYSEALALWPEDDAERPNLLLRYGRVLFPHGRGEDVLSEAAEELLDAGDREAAAEAETLLGDVIWLAGRHEDAFGHFEGAVALLADEPPSRAKAFALGELARFRMMGDEAESAVRAGSEALEMAEALGLDELRASALNTLGVCRVLTGDLDGLGDLERAIDISRGLRSFQLTRALNNLASTLMALGELQRAYAIYTEAAEVAARVGWSAAVRWLEAEEIDWNYHRGQWDEAVVKADAILADAGSALRHIREIDARVIRALVRLSRGDDEGADEDSAAGLGFAKGSMDPQTLFPALACRGRVLLETGSATEAGAVLADLLARWRANPLSFASTWLTYAAPAIIALGRAGELAELLRNAPVKTRWLEAVLALAEGDPRGSARIFAQIGSIPDEAHARLKAAEVLAPGHRAEADVELDLALSFFRQVGASRYIRAAEALLEPT